MRKTRVARQPHAPARPGSRLNFWIPLALLSITIAVYFQARRFDYVNFDDPDYVTANPLVRQGISAGGLRWAFTSTKAANWFPLTRISHMLDCELFGLNSGMHHLMNVLLHALAAAMCFAFLYRATRAPWPSAFVVWIFALHPLHVESVAWIAERKDVLSAVFWFITLYAYVRYAEQPSFRRYAAVVVAFCFGIMSKPMIVTLPFVLLLLDFWPLGRRAWLIREKVPLFVLSAAAAVATYFIQSASHAVRPGETLPLALRIENALVSYMAYVANMFWPAHLAVFYPYPTGVPAWAWAAAALAIVLTSIAAVKWREEYPFFAVGWFWFVGTLVPVIGIVQAGSQARADRYTYIPLVGLSIVLAWGADSVVKLQPRMKPVVVGFAVVSCALCVLATSNQLQFWTNSEALFRHAVQVTEGNYLALHNLGSALLDDPNRLQEALDDLNASLRIKPDSASVHADIGTAFAKLGHSADAIAEYQTALRIEPDSEIVQRNLAAVRRNAGAAENNLGAELSENPQHLNEAIAHYQAALRLDPDSAEAHYNLGVALAKTNRSEAAVEQFKDALRIKPDYAEAHNDLGVALSHTRLPEAIAHFEAALRIRPSYASAHYNLGVALSQIPGQMPEAIAELEIADRIQPDPQLEGIIRRLRMPSR